jgi:membrane protease YdiL (CAAX protease family)
MAEGATVNGGVQSWGIFGTLVIGATALVAGQLSGIAALVGWYGFDLRNVPTLSEQGGAIILFIFVSAPVQVAILALAAAYKDNVAAYLGYRLPRRGEIVLSLAILAAMIAAGDTISWLAGRNIVDRFQTDIYQAARSVDQLPLLLVAVIVLIPIGEETLFRGFLIRGWLKSPRLAWPVILVTAALFAIIHVQYDWFLILQVFAFGVLFGWTRWATGSTLLTMLLHTVVNLEGMLETFLVLSN